MARWGRPTNWMSLGHLRDVSSWQAEHRLAGALALVARGINPRGPAMSFEEAADHYLREGASRWADDRYERTQRLLLKRWVLPAIGSKLIGRIEPEHVDALVARIEASSTARKALALIALVIDWARETDRPTR